MNGPINWMGGKTFSALRIIARIPDHECYVEPFAGGAKVFFRKDRAKVEVLNDLDEELLNFYRCVKQSAGRVARLLTAMPHSRALFLALQREEPSSRGAFHRAARFWYLQKSGFGGRRIGRTFGYSRSRRPWSNVSAVRESIMAAGKRLEGVTLECLPFDQVAGKYDGEGTFFYCDPPYVDMPYYQHNFEEADHRRLAAVLRNVAGRWLLSYNDHPLVRKLYAWAKIEELPVPYRIRCISARPGRELLIGPSN